MWRSRPPGPPSTMLAGPHAGGYVSAPPAGARRVDQQVTIGVTVNGVRDERAVQPRVLLSGLPRPEVRLSRKPRRSADRGGGARRPLAGRGRKGKGAAWGEG